MSGIKRFNHGVCEYPGGTFSEMNQESDGEYVLHSDHEAEVARLRAEVEHLTEAFRCRTIDWNEACNARDGWARKAKDVRAEADSYRKDAERYAFLKDERTGSYGDGYTEPKEAHLCLEWQQGPWIRDGSNGGLGRPDVFPGWDSIVDEMMASAVEDEDDAEIDAAMGEGK